MSEMDGPPDHCDSHAGWEPGCGPCDVAMGHRAAWERRQVPAAAEQERSEQRPPRRHCDEHREPDPECLACRKYTAAFIVWAETEIAAERAALARLPESIHGAELLDLARAMVDKYVRFPDEHCAVAVTLWIAHTWAVSAFYVTPRLVLDSPEPGSGKTRVLELCALLCRSAKLTLSTTTAALYRRIAAAEIPPTVLQDEADAIFGRTTTPQNEDLRALFNAGYKRGATVDRCEGDSKNMKVREFPVFAPVALAGIAGNMPATITTRSVTVHMRRRAPGEKVAPFRERDADTEAAPIREALEAWAAANLAALEAARPTMPDGVEDRPAEVWEALIAVADIAGGKWPTLARAACKRFVLNADPGGQSFGVRLLGDVHKAFGDRDAMHSADVVAVLVADEEAPYADLYGKPLNQRKLSEVLKKYGVESRQIKINGTGSKGYRIDGPDGLIQAWERYLPGYQRNSRNQRNSAGQTVSQSGAVSEDTKPVSDGFADGFGSDSKENRSDQVKQSPVSLVSEVSHTPGFRSDETGPGTVRTPGRKVGQWLGSGAPVNGDGAA